LTSDLDIVNSTATEAEGADVRTWRVITICADARSNIESDIIEHLASVWERFQLAGLTYAPLHGIAVIVLLVHEAGAEQRDHERSGSSQQRKQSRAALENNLRTVPGLAKVQVLLDERLSRNELGRFTEYPMLRVRFRWRDRPGAFLNVLGAISSVLSEELPTIQQTDWSISYAALQVLTGQVALGSLTIRLHIPAERISSWTPKRMEEMGRKMEITAAYEALRESVPDVSRGNLDRLEDPLISIDRVKKPSANFN
jgi:hypothetical protein